jgi:hypothetical protein
VVARAEREEQRRAVLRCGAKRGTGIGAAPRSKGERGWVSLQCSTRRRGTVVMTGRRAGGDLGHTAWEHTSGRAGRLTGRCNPFSKFELIFHLQFKCLNSKIKNIAFPPLKIMGKSNS